MNKYIFLLSLFWTFASMIFAQNITRLEYSIDGFVAEGNGTALEIPGNSTELDTEFQIDISGLEPGNHTIHFRAMNEDGVWSFSAERSFYVTEPPITEGIVAVEYSIDEMVKEGDGNLIALHSGTNQLDTTLQFDISGLDPGTHNIYMRAKNKLGIWSMPAQGSFVIAEPDTARIENIYYRIYNDEFESVWMTASVDPARRNVDSTIMASVAGLDLDNNYTLEFYAENNLGVRGFSAYLSNIDLMMNHPPERTKDAVELFMSVNQVLELSMDSLFNDEDLNFGDSLVYEITNADNTDLMDFADWETGSLLSLSPVSGYLGNYMFWLKTTDLAGESDSVQVMLTVTGATGVEDMISDKRFRVYPNPASDYVNIKMVNGHSSGYKIMLYSTTGKLQYSKNVEDSEYTLSLNKYHGGIYFIVLQNSEFMIRKKLIIR